MSRKFSAKQVAEAITQTRGFITYTARHLGCDRGTVYNYINQFSVCRQAFNDTRENMLDTAEMRLWEKINAGDTTAIIFTLKTIGKARGYIERHDIGLALSPEVQAMTQQLGINKQDIVREFEALIRAEAERVTNN